MAINKESFRNPNVYTAFALTILFLLMTGLIPGNKFIFNIGNSLLKFLVVSMFLIGASSSAVFIISKIFKN